MAWPTTPLDVAVSLALGANLSAAPSSWSWTDITTKVYVRGGIAINRGRADEQAQSEPSTVTLTLDNRDGRFVPRNPIGPYFGLIGRNTPLRVSIGQVVTDAFGRTVSNGWGASDSGHVWSVGGTASDYSVSSGTARMSMGSLNVNRDAFFESISTVDFDLFVDFKQSAVPTGVGAEYDVMLRYVDDNNFVGVRIFPGTAGTTTMAVRQMVAGIETVVGFPTISGVSPTTFARLRFQGIGSKLRARGWLVGSAEPSTWLLEMATTHLTPGRTQIRAKLPTGTTNGLPVTVEWDNLDDRRSRFVGYVNEWPTRWDLSDKDRWVQVTASGVLRRLGQGQTPLRSALYRAVTRNPTPPLHYWPLEDGADATQGLPWTDSPPLAPTGSVTFGATAAGGSAAAVDASGGGKLTAATPGGSTTSWSVDVYTKWGTDHAAVDALGGTHVLWWGIGSGTWASFRLTYDAGAPVRLVKVDSAGVTTTLASTGTQPFDGRVHHYRVTALQNGGNIDLKLYQDGVQVTTNSVAGTLGKIIWVRTNPDDPAVAGTQTGDWVPLLAHLAIWSPDSGVDLSSAASGYVGELAGVRFLRLCGEEIITADVRGTDVATYAMGAQTVATLLDLLRQCEAAGAGVIVERLGGELGLDLATYRENQTVVLTLDYGLGHVAPPLEPTDDDQRTRNDITVTRVGGSSARFIDSAGPLGTAKVGVYDEGLQISLAADDQAIQHAGWRVGLGTVNETRYPRVVINLRAAPGLIPTWLDCDVGTRVTLAHLPAYISTEDADLIIEGYAEELFPFEWLATLNSAPYQPFSIFTLAATSGDASEFLGHLDWDTCVTAEALDTTETGVDVTTTPLITTASDDFPFDILVGGERMSVTACTGAANPQTLTVVRSVNGVVKTHLIGATVELHPDFACYLGL